MNNSSDMHEPSTKNMSRRFSYMKCEQSSDVETKGITLIKAKKRFSGPIWSLLYGVAVGLVWAVILVVLSSFFGYANLR
mgnify:FL=1|tara:strand:+ start:118 stop:354 length:237 start_codon:yes stop_codon:yes gene_type:complete